MNFFHFGAKSEKDISEIQTKYKSKIWHKCSEHKHYNGLPKELPILIGIVSTKGKFSKKNLVLKLYLDKILFFKINANGLVSDHPYAIMFLEFDLKIKWIFTKKTDEKNQITGFKIMKFNDSIEFLGECSQFLYRLKELTATFFFSFNFQDDFTVIKPIGKGSSAIVYLGEHTETKQQFAIKACKKDKLFSQKKWKDILFFEINSLRILNHPNIIKLHALYETENSFSLVFDSLEGGNLASFLQKNPEGLTEEQCFQIMKGILSGLSYMHSKKIMHRDIKPENILFKKASSIFDENNVCIADFGLATTQNVTKYLFFRCGTPGYIAPEVINTADSKLKYSEKCDVFSAGSIMYFLMTGQKLFYGAKFDQVVMLNRKAHIDFNVLKKKYVSEESIDLIKRMLTRESSNRISAEDALSHPYFNPNRLKLSLEEEEFSLQLKEFDSKGKINSPSIKENFDFSCKNYNIFSQNLQKRENLINNENEEDINNLIVQIPVMNGFLETLNNISLQEIIFMKSLKPSTIENPIKNINSKKIQKEEKENHNIYNEGSI